MHTTVWRAVHRAVLWLTILAALPPAKAANTAVAVLNFANTDARGAAESNRWLGKGLADLLIADLTVSEKLRVVTREDMQLLMQEADLIDKTTGANALPDDAAGKIKEYVKVDRLVFGTYAVDGDKVTVGAQVIDQESGRVLGQFSQTGTVSRVLGLEKALARSIMIFLEGGDARVAPPVLPQWTDSVPAAQHLYQGIDLFDHGEYTLALYEFLSSERADPNYADAHYWRARMYYYRQEYDHARFEYAGFVHDFPKHARVGDAAMEFIHSYECLSDDPEELLKLYRSFRTRDWEGVRVHNQVDFVAASPLADWVLKREQQVMLYQQKYAEAFGLLDRELSETRVPKDTEDRRWRYESARLMATLAELSEDTLNQRLTSTNLPYYRDLALTVDHPFLEQDLRGRGLEGPTYTVGNNYRILAPTGYCVKSVTARIERTNDPEKKTVCRLQIRRYRYVDINACWTSFTTPAHSNYAFKIAMPPGCTWFYLRPEYDGHGEPPCKASFDGWSLEAKLAPLVDFGRVDLHVLNTVDHQALVDGTYARCFNGIIPNLSPGPHKIVIKSMVGGPWGFEPQTNAVVVTSNETLRLDVRLCLSAKARAAGWQDPVCVTETYPVFKLRPQHSQNWRSGRPSTWIDPATGRRVVVWAHLDDIWLATSDDGVTWSPPANLEPPVNSAHVELSPRIIRDEQGRYCLLFLSDRGAQRSLASYVCWSKDLRSWSRPVMVSPSFYEDQDLIQARNGEYFFVGTAPQRHAALPAGLQITHSSDLVHWSTPEVMVELGTPQAVCVRQDRQGLYHLLIGGNLTMHLVSDDFEEWRESSRLSRISWSPGSVISAAVTGDALVAVVGGPNEMYGGGDIVEVFACRLGGGTTDLEKLEVPPGVIGGMCDLAYDTHGDKVVATWQTASMRLNSVLPAGPVYTMSGQPAAWHNAKPEAGSTKVAGKP